MRRRKTTGVEFLKALKRKYEKEELQNFKRLSLFSEYSFSQEVSLRNPVYPNRYSEYFVFKKDAFLQWTVFALVYV